MGTTEAAEKAGLPVRSLRVVVEAGPDEGARVDASEERLTVGTAEGNDLVLRDPTVSRFHAELIRRGDGVQVLDHASTNGTRAHGVRLCDAIVDAGTELTLGHTTLRVVDGAQVTVALHEESELGELVGRTPVMRRLMHRIARAARSRTPVLLIGESGSGKELIAQALHPGDAPFVTVDCGALAPALVASELFGHEKGAFTGADRRHIGAFERAHGGTLFLDEIGELPASIQATLLGALERRRFRRIGGRDEVEVDVRVVSATHRDLRGEVNAGRFRLDLYYRIAVVVLAIPPLRERTEDIPLLVERFLRHAGHDGPVEDVIGAELMSVLSAHRWPGNVRELRNVVEATLAMGEAPPLYPDLDTSEPWAGLGYKEARAAVLHDFESRYLPKLLERASGNVSRAAREGRMDRTYLIKLLQKHGLR
ncbi:MAG: sigma 54-interacting transcriptional regulator [Myxococcota bacterium]